MARIEQGFLGGFSGKLGPAVGYLWNGKWCLRSRPGQVHNPRTEAQQAHRAAFREEVRLAARLRWVLLQSLTEPARAAGMTAYNLFVSLNQHAFSEMDGELRVDYPSLVLSTGPVAPVQAERVTVAGGTQLEVDFERNPLHLASNYYDSVHLYVYSPALGQGYLAAPVYRRQKKISVLLPDQFAGSEVHLYLYVSDQQGRCSETAYGGSLTLADGASSAADTTADTLDADRTDGTGKTGKTNGERELAVATEIDEVANAPSQYLRPHERGYPTPQVS